MKNRTLLLLNKFCDHTSLFILGIFVEFPSCAKVVHIFHFCVPASKEIPFFELTSDAQLAI